MGNLSIFIGGIALLELVMAIILCGMLVKTRRPLTLCVMLICFGLFWDAFLIAVGGPLGGLPEGLSRTRFLAHGALIPLFIPICGYGLKAGKNVMRVLWVFTALVIVLGAAHAFAIDLELTTKADVIRHTMAATSPKWARTVSSVLSFGTVIPLIVCGIIVWVRQKNANLFLSGFLMYIFAAVGPATGHMDLIFFLSMFGEVFMILFALFYIRKDEKKAKEKNTPLAKTA